ncbi:hypothetical protein ACEN9F_30605 [Duganella sp. CT11-25]|uniref:hypothetical protein n=1 Tax=unclassified Duganella TaxID=2636909 RepID=UPI0039AF1A66
MKMPSLKMRKHKYPSLGFCIFCLKPPSDDPLSALTIEHIVTKTLGGTLLFLGGTCTRCARFGNQRFEQLAINTDFLVIRNLIRLTNKAPSRSFPPIYYGNQVVPATLATFPKVISMFVPPVAGKLRGIDVGDGVSNFRFIFINITRYYPQSVRISERQEYTTSGEPTSFGLALAKAAYCFAVGEFGIDGFDGTEIRQLLNGERIDVYNFVGEPVAKERMDGQDLHQLLPRYRDGGVLTILVHLFASYGVPPYEVVMGKFTPPGS